MPIIEAKEIRYEIRDNSGNILSSFDDLSIAKVIIGWRREDADKLKTGETFKIYKVTLNRKVVEG